LHISLLMDRKLAAFSYEVEANLPAINVGHMPQSYQFKPNFPPCGPSLRCFHSGFNWAGKSLLLCER
jgi:hypothetical protein